MNLKLRLSDEDQLRL